MTLQERMEKLISSQSENLLPRTNTIVQIELKNNDYLFQNFKKPIDLFLNGLYIDTCKQLIQNVDGSHVIYQYSNKFILLIKDFSRFNSIPFLAFNRDLVISQITSIASSMITRLLDLNNIILSYEDKTMKINNNDMIDYLGNTPFPIINTIVYQINDPVELENMMIYHQKLSKKQAIDKIFKYYFPRDYVRSSPEKIERLKSKNININSYPDWFLKGILFSKENKTFSDAYSAFDFVKSRDQLTEMLEI